MHHYKVRKIYNSFVTRAIKWVVIQELARLPKKQGIELAGWIYLFYRGVGVSYLIDSLKICFDSSLGFVFDP